MDGKKEKARKEEGCREKESGRGAKAGGKSTL